MIYDVRQTTAYAYASTVAYAHHVLRLTPIDRSGQRVQAAALDIAPAPVKRREGRDFFGNRLTWIDLAEPHDRMVIKVKARIAVETAAAPSPDATPAWEAVRTRPLPATTSARARRRISCSPAGSSRSIPRSATMCARAFRPDGRSSPARPT